MGKSHSRTWTWRFDSPVEKIWPLLANTARFNEAAALPKHEIEEVPRADGSVLYLGRLRFGPFRIAWEDEPVNWVEGRWFRHRRGFLNGPFKSLCATLRFSPADGGCTGAYTLEAEPANALGQLMLAGGFFRNTRRSFTRLAGNARDFAKGERPLEFDAKPPRLAPGAAERAQVLVSRIEAGAFGHGLAGRLAEWVMTRQDVDVGTIRPLKIARLWGVPERHAVELCLEGARQGLLKLRWDLLCPRCRVGKASAASLDQLPTGAHCPTCNIRYDRNYTKNVELAFQPAQSIRPVEPGEYCLFGPMSTPHVKLQLTLAPGQALREPVDLRPGHYRVRTLEPGPEETLEWAGGAFPEIAARGRNGDAIAFGAPSSPGQLALRNETGRPLTFIVEEREWARDALTAHRATALQAFRDIFTSAVLRPGDAAEVDRITLMFTDLKGSTALYDRIGDAEAYALVREHFAVLAGAVRECDGAIVKTIGDAIMAAFVNPADGLGCALRIQDDFARFNASSGKEPVTVKLGLHVGRCIAVTLNDKLDYYGSAANMTARLESRSRGGDVVISAELARDPDVARLLAGYRPVEEQADLKGFAQPVPYYRITAEELASRRN